MSKTVSLVSILAIWHLILCVIVTFHFNSKNWYLAKIGRMTRVNCVYTMLILIFDFSGIFMSKWVTFLYQGERMVYSKKHSTSTHILMVITSKPINVFKTLFKHHTTFKIRIHAVSENSGKISRFLHQHIKFPSLCYKKEFHKCDWCLFFFYLHTR